MRDFSCAEDYALATNAAIKLNGLVNLGTLGHDLGLRKQLNAH